MKKIFIKLIALVTFVSIFSGHLYSQRDTMNFYPGLLWVTIADSSAKPNENNKTTLNSDLNQLFSTYKVTSLLNSSVKCNLLILQI